jgi:hypothetical protein
MVRAGSGNRPEAIGATGPVEIAETTGHLHLAEAERGKAMDAKRNGGQRVADVVDQVCQRDTFGDKGSLDRGGYIKNAEAERDVRTPHSARQSRRDTCVFGTAGRTDPDGRLTDRRLRSAGWGGLRGRLLRGPLQLSRMLLTGL